MQLALDARGAVTDAAVSTTACARAWQQLLQGVASPAASAAALQALEQGLPRGATFPRLVRHCCKTAAFLGPSSSSASSLPLSVAGVLSRGLASFSSGLISDREAVVLQDVGVWPDGTIAVVEFSVQPAAPRPAAAYLAGSASGGAGAGGSGGGDGRRRDEVDGSQAAGAAAPGAGRRPGAATTPVSPAALATAAAGGGSGTGDAVRSHVFFSVYLLQQFTAHVPGSAAAAAAATAGSRPVSHSRAGGGRGGSKATAAAGTRGATVAAGASTSKHARPAAATSVPSTRVSVPLTRVTRLVHVDMRGYLPSILSGALAWMHAVTPLVALRAAADKAVSHAAEGVSGAAPGKGPMSRQLAGGRRGEASKSSSAQPPTPAIATLPAALQHSIRSELAALPAACLDGSLADVAGVARATVAACVTPSLPDAAASGAAALRGSKGSAAGGALGGPTVDGAAPGRGGLHAAAGSGPGARGTAAAAAAAAGMPAGPSFGRVTDIVAAGRRERQRLSQRLHAAGASGPAAASARAGAGASRGAEGTGSADDDDEGAGLLSESMLQLAAVFDDSDAEDASRQPSVKAAAAAGKRDSGSASAPLAPGAAAKSAAAAAGSADGGASPSKPPAGDMAPSASLAPAAADAAAPTMAPAAPAVAPAWPRHLASLLVHGDLQLQPRPPGPRSMQYLQRLHREPWEGWEESLDGLDDAAEGSLLLDGGDGVDGDGMPDGQGSGDGAALAAGSAAGSLRRKRSSRETAQRLTAAAELLQREASAKNLRAATDQEGAAAAAADNKAGATGGQEARSSGGRSSASTVSPRGAVAGGPSVAWGFNKGPQLAAAAQPGVGEGAPPPQQQVAQKPQQQPFADVPMDDTLSQLSPVVRAPVAATAPGEASPAFAAAESETSVVSGTAGAAGAATGVAATALLSARPAVADASVIVRPAVAEAPTSPAEEQALPSLAVSRVGLADFELLAVLGRGGYGKVMLVRRVRRTDAPHSSAAATPPVTEMAPAARVSPAPAADSPPSSPAAPAALQSPGPKDEGAVYALKVLRKRDIIARDQVQRTQTERQILSALAHPFIVRLHYAFQTASKLCLVLDYLPGGDFFSLLHRGGPVSEEQAVLYGAELVLALEHLHDHGIVWRDCKPENVLLAADGHLRLTDFGLARYTPPQPPPAAAAASAAGSVAPAGREGGRQRGGGSGAGAGPTSPAAAAADPAAGGGDDSAGPSWRSPQQQQQHPGSRASEQASAPRVEDDEAGLELPPGLQPAYATVTRSFCGTEQYMAPEQLLQTGHNGAADWWGLGILLSELMTGRHPFRIPQPRGTGGAGGSGGAAAAHLDLLRNIVHPDVPPATLHLMSPVAAHLVAGLLQKDPSQRMGSPSMGGAAAVRAHPFFRYRPYPGAPYPEVLVWEKVMRKEYTPLYIPALRASSGAAAATASAAATPAAGTVTGGTAGGRPAAAGGKAGAPAPAGSAAAFDISHFDAVFTSEPVRDSQASLPGSRERGPASASAALAGTGAAAASGGNIGRPPRFAAEPSFSAFSYTRGASPPGPYDSDYDDEGEDDEEEGDDDDDEEEGEEDAGGRETDASESGDE